MWISYGGLTVTKNQRFGLGLLFLAQFILSQGAPQILANIVHIIGFSLLILSGED